MFGNRRRRGWRRAIGLIAAYALALQTFFAYGAATEAAASGAHAGASFVVCVGNSDGSIPDNTAPTTTSTHCPICTLASFDVGTAPDALAIAIQYDAAAKRTPFVAVTACISFHQARAGLTRAPPQNA